MDICMYSAQKSLFYATAQWQQKIKITEKTNNNNGKVLKKSSHN